MCAKVSVVDADVGANRRGDGCVVCPASGYPHHENRLDLSSADDDDAYASDVLRQGECERCRLKVVSPPPRELCSLPPSGPVLLDFGSCRRWGCRPASPSPCHPKGERERCLRRLDEPSSTAPPILIRIAPSSAPCASARGPTSRPGHATIAAHVPQPPPPAPAPNAPHATGPRVPCEFRRLTLPAREGCSCYGHLYCE